MGDCRIASKNLLLFVLFLTLLFSGCQDQVNFENNFDDLPALHIDISPEHMTLIKRKRAVALKHGLLNSNSKDFVPATLTYKDSTLTGQVRLKGDWLDHLRGKKWSLRIKLDSLFAFMGMQQFSIQHPRTRSYLDEWVFHQLLSKEDILTTKYSFIRVWWNGEYKGIYALEEHFEQTLIEKNLRREGPILKFAEDGFWQCQEYHQHYSKNLVPYLPDFEAAEIESFQSKKVRADTGLSDAFLKGKHLLEQLRLGHGDVDKIFDVDRLARFYALCDIASGYHALRWHNLRYYYNPVTMTLEPIAFDAYSSDGPYRWFSKPFLGFQNERYRKLYFAEEYMIFFPFNDPDFRKRYRQYLQKFSNEDYILKFTKTIESRLNQLERALKTEFSAYQYDRNLLIEGADKMERALESYSLTSPDFVYEIYDPLYEDCKTLAPLPAISVKAHRANSMKTVFLSNYFCKPIQVVATGPKRSKPIHVLEQPIKLPSFDIYNQPPPAFDIPMPENDKYVFYEVPGVDYWYKIKTSKWPHGQENSSFDEGQLQIQDGIFEKKGDTLVLKEGAFAIEQNLVIPKSYTLMVNAGTSLDFVRGAACFIFGGVSLQGSEQNPVKIISSDTSSRGWHMIQNTGTVLINHVHFDQMGTWRQGGRILTGGVTLYEAKAKIQNSSFYNSQAEDALNIIRSDSVKLEALTFRNCISDALDIDFSTMVIEDCRFEKIKGDALDLAGTKANISGIKISEVDDKGISIGENSIGDIQKVECNSAYIGIAVKDGSSLHGDGLKFDSCYYDLAIFNKKPIYDESMVMIEKIDFSKSGDYKYLLEDQNKFTIKDDTMPATHSSGQLRQMLYYEPK